MLIQNNSNTLITKYISIYLKETFNSNVTVTSIYDNSKYNYFNIGDNIFINGYICDNSNNYGYVIGQSADVIENQETNYILPNNTYTDIAIKLNDNFKVIKVDNTGKLEIDDNGNYILVDTWTTDTTLFINKTDCRNYDSLISYIYQWLNSRYKPMLDKEIHNTVELTNCNIATYFIEGNKLLNPNKTLYDIDDIIFSYILNRTISDMSTPDEIEYAQNLLKNNKYLKISERNEPTFRISNYIECPGMWDNLHELIYIYQNQLNFRYCKNQSEFEYGDPNFFTIVIPTGFLDIVTEKYLLMEQGGENNGYYNTTNNILYTI